MGKKSSKKEKVMVMPVAKGKAVKDAVQQVNALQSLVASAGWAIIVKILDDNISYLEKAILEKQDPQTKLVLTDEAVEKLRYKRSLNIELKNTPQNYSKILTDIEKAPDVFDPYWSMKDIKDMESSLTKK